MSEFITIQVGQCGNQIGGTFWPMVLKEHGIQTESVSVPKKTCRLPNELHSFFSIPEKSKTDIYSYKTLSDLKEHNVKARVICIDMEDSVVARYRSGHLRHLYDDNCLVTNYPGSGNNWAEGYYTHGNAYHDKISNVLRQSAERCDQLHGFLMIFSLGGGTGSGLGTATLRMLQDQYPDIDRFAACVYPAYNEDVITSPYNVALATKQLSEDATCVFPIANKALFDICTLIRKNNSKTMLEPSTRNFADANGIVVDMLLHLTSGSRFQGSLNVDMNELATNMVPYPRLHFITSSVSPFCHQEKILKTLKAETLFTDCVSRFNQLVTVKPLHGLVMAATFIARGDLALTDIRANIRRFERKAKFPPWNSTPVKLGICSVPPPGFDSSLLCLMNTSSITPLFQDLLAKFNRLYNRRAHCHHYYNVDAFEDDHFADSRENLMATISQYKGLEKCKPIKRSRFHVV